MQITDNITGSDSAGHPPSHKKHIGLISNCLVLSFALILGGCGGESKTEKKSKAGEAKVGVGRKGEGYGNNVPILKPAATFWKAKEKIAFEIAIPKAMQLYEALNGRKPKSHQEFMKEIISKNRIKLPELEEGLEYFYDAKQGKLMARNQAAVAESEK